MAARPSPEEKKRSKRYGRMFSALFFGMMFLVTGLAGFKLNKTPLSSDARWADGPILSQIAAGIAGLALGIYWSRRLDDPRLDVAPRAPRTVKNVGAGQSHGAAMKSRPRLERPTGSRG